MTFIPLTPQGGGGVCIPDAALQIADMVVSTTTAGISAAIKGATLSWISHAMLYAGGGDVIEAVSEGVTQHPLGAALRNAKRAVAYRVKDITPAEAIKVVSFATKWIGKKYDYGGAAGAGIARNMGLCYATGIVICAGANAELFNATDRFYCSELVLEAFRQAKKPISNIAPGRSVPQDIVNAYANGTLQYVGHLIAA